jgi:hypothetical protein
MTIGVDPEVKGQSSVGEGDGTNASTPLIKKQNAPVVQARCRSGSLMHGALIDHLKANPDDDMAGILPREERRLQGELDKEKLVESKKKVEVGQEDDVSCCCFSRWFSP